MGLSSLLGAKPRENEKDLEQKQGNQELITCQCEALLKAADEIRNEQKIRGLGILDRRLKNMIGRLRKKSAIESVFNSAENKSFENYKKEADQKP